MRGTEWLSILWRFCFEGSAFVENKLKSGVNMVYKRKSLILVFMLFLSLFFNFPVTSIAGEDGEGVVNSDTSSGIDGYQEEVEEENNKKDRSVQSSNSDKELLIRVGWYKRDGYYDKDNDGNISGFGVDYLNAIAEYTGWKYVFIEGTKSQCEAWLESGYINILSPIGEENVLKNAYIAREVIGEDYGYIYKLNNKFDINYEETESFTNLTVGMVRGGELRENLERYCLEKGFQFHEIKIYDTLDGMIKDLASGKVDAIITDSYVKVENLKVIGRFSNGRVTLAVSSRELVEELNKALENLKLDYPSLNSDLKKLYFDEGSQKNLEFLKEEKDFLEKEHKFKLAILKEQYPISYKVDEQETYKGIILDIIEKIEHYTGFEMELQYVDRFSEAVLMTKNRDVDFVGGVVLSTQQIESGIRNDEGNVEYIHTVPFYEMRLSLVGRKNTDMDANLEVAMPAYLSELLSLFKNLYPQYTFITYAGDEECIEGILAKEVDVAIQSDLKLNDLIIYDKYKEIHNLEYIPGNYGVTLLLRNENRLLFSVLNKAINSVSATERSTIVNDNIQHVDIKNMSVKDFLVEYRDTIIWLCMILIAIITALGGYTKYRREKKSKERAYKDSVTGISSMEKFRIDVAPILHSSDKTNYYVVTIDIDKFKVINDLYGYDQGDKTIAYLAKVLRAGLSQGDYITRSVADNFVIFKRADNRRQIKEFLSESFNIVDKTVTDEKVHYRMIIKAGIYHIREEDWEISSVIDKANLAKNTMKRWHHSSYNFYSEEMRQKNLEAKKMENDMEKALLNSEFCIYLQPQVDLATKKIVSAEALVRWKHSTEGMIPPGKFIPVFENNGFVVRLDLFVWEEAIKTLVKWKENNQFMVPIAINLSRIDVEREGMIEQLIELMDKYQLECKWIKTELTESACLDNDDMILTKMKQLKDYGFKIAIDDFGSGYSSLNLLTKMPIDILKIDKSFLDINIDMPLNDEIVMRDLVDMGKHLNLQIIIEGVETREQSDFLEAIGCDIAQGYLYGAPMSIEEFEKVLEKDQKGRG